MKIEIFQYEITKAINNIIGSKLKDIKHINSNMDTIELIMSNNKKYIITIEEEEILNGMDYDTLYIR